MGWGLNVRKGIKLAFVCVEFQRTVAEDGSLGYILQGGMWGWYQGLADSLFHLSYQETTMPTQNEASVQNTAQTMHYVIT